MQIRDRVLDLRRVRAKDLIPNPKNWRTHPKPQQEALRGILAEIGYADALLARETERGLELIDGHLRAETTPDQEVPVLVLDLTPEEADKLLASLDPLAAMAGKNDELLRELLAGIDTESDALRALWDELIPPDPKDGLTDPDDVPEPPAIAKTKPGDLYLLGEHRLLCGDSASAADVDRLLDGAPIHLANTDPPYNVKVEPRSNNAIAAGNSSFRQTHHQKLDLARHPEKARPTHRQLRAKDRPLVNDFVSDEDFARLLRAWFGNLSRVLLPGHGFYIWGGYANVANYPSALKESGLYFSQTVIWNKLHPVLTRKDFMGAHEWCFYGWREGAAHRFFGPPSATDLWEIKKVNPQQMSHLCLHPDALVLTESGYRPIQSMAPDDRVYGVDGRFHAVTHVSSHAYQSPHLVRITARGGNLPTLASDNHPFLVWRPRRRRRSIVGGSVGWLRADEMRAGDYTMTPLLAEPETDPLPERDEEFWFLFGLYLAQGSLQKAGHGENRYPSFHLHKKRQDLVARIRDQWDSVSEYDPDDYGERSQGLTVMAFDPEAGAAFEELGGRLSHAKRLAPVVFRLPRAKRVAVFEGWLDGDGCQVHDRSYWQGNTCSPDLAVHLQLLAESVGYRVNLFRYDPPVELGMINGRRIRSARPVYNLYFYRRDPTVRRGTFTHIEHEGREYSLRYVKSVERVPYTGDVWNLTVDGSHTFQTAVGLSHNTEKPVELATRAIQYSSLPGENVLDLFGGSGSTLIAAERTGRKAYLMEMDPLYCDVIVERWESFVGRKAELAAR